MKWEKTYPKFSLKKYFLKTNKKALAVLFSFFLFVFFAVSISGSNKETVLPEEQSVQPKISLNVQPEILLNKQTEKINDDFVWQPKTFIPEISADGYIVVDINSGTVLSGKNTNTVKPMASVTKLMTSLLALEKINFNDKIEISEKMLAVHGETPNLNLSEKYRMIDLLYPSLTMSSNQAAEALAGFLGREVTLDYMNEKAKLIGMKSTFFDDPSGLSEKNVSTPQDISILLKEIYFENPVILDITKSQKIYDDQEIFFDMKEMENRNIFIYDSTFVGGKTGYTKKAGNTAAFIFKLKIDDVERPIAIVLLNSKGLRSDTQKIYGWLLKNNFKI